MPFKSEKQRRYMHANLPEIAQRWEKDYANGGVASQGGVKNYLGEQPMVSAPKYWQSSPDHPTTELAYITPAEKDLLVKQDLHGSLNGGVNRGPSGIMSLNGWGSADASENRAGSDISAGMDKSASDAGWADTSTAYMTGPTGKSPAELSLLAAKKGSTTVMPSYGYQPSLTWGQRIGQGIQNIFSNTLLGRLARQFGPLDNRAFYEQKVVPAGKTTLGYDDWLAARMAGRIDAYGNLIDPSTRRDPIPRRDGIASIYDENIVNGNIEDENLTVADIPFESRFLQNQPEDVRKEIEAGMQNYYTV